MWKPIVDLRQTCEAIDIYSLSIYPQTGERTNEHGKLNPFSIAYRYMEDYKYLSNKLKPSIVDSKNLRS